MANPKRERQKQGRQLRQEYLRQQQRRSARRRQIIAVAIAVIVVVGIAFLYGRGGKKKATSVSSKATTTTATSVASTSTTARVPVAYGSTACPPADGSAPHTTSFKDSFAKCIDPAKKYTATMETSEGTINIELYPKEAPQHVNSFVFLSRDGYYDGPIDGILGPSTQDAIAAFQDDNGLAVTSAIDEPTLATLGIA